MTMRNWNKGCWVNIVIGILWLIIGSIEENLIMMIVGMFSLLVVGMFWTQKLGLLSKKQDESISKEKQNEKEIL